MKKHRLIYYILAAALVFTNCLVPIAQEEVTDSEELILCEVDDLIIEESQDIITDEIWMEDFVENTPDIYLEIEKELEYWEFVPSTEEGVFMQDVETNEWIYNLDPSAVFIFSSEQKPDFLPRYLDLVYAGGFTERIAIDDWKIEKTDNAALYIAQFDELNMILEDEIISFKVYLPDLEEPTAETVVTEEQQTEYDATILETMPEETDITESEESMTEEISEQEEQVTEETSESEETITEKVPELEEMLTETPSASEEPITEEITQAEIKVELLQEIYTYTGEEIFPEVRISLDDIVLVQDIDYSLSYENNTDAGTGNILIDYIDGTYPSQEIEFKILPQELDIRTSYISDAYYIYNGGEIIPDIIIKGTNGEGELFDLVLGTDYTVSYYNKQAQAEDLVNVGDIEVTINGTGNFIGELNGMYHIVACSLSEFQVIVTD